MEFNKRIARLVDTAVLERSRELKRLNTKRDARRRKPRRKWRRPRASLRPLYDPENARIKA